VTQVWERKDIRVLLVDDDAVDRMSVRRALAAGDLGVEVLEASDATAGLELLRAERIDAVFLDFNMPGRDGLWLVRNARQLGVRCPLIVLTGQGDEQTAVELMKAGATDYFSKATLTPERAVRSLRHSLHVVEVEAALRESEQRARLAVEATQLGTWELESRSGVLKLSERCRTLLGIEPHEPATYERFLSSVHPEDREPTHRAISHALESESSGVYDVEHRSISVSGETSYWLRSIGKVFPDEYGRPSRLIGTVQDIGVQKHLEAQRARLFDAERSAREQAEAASRMREDLIAIVSHDLRNPLSSISMSVEVLQAVIPEDVTPRTKKPIETIVRSAGRMKRLISDLLDVASIDGGALAVSQEELGVSHLIREAVEMMLPFAADKSILLEAPQADVGLTVFADKERVLQVFSNLIGNAIKFTREGGHIWLSAELQDEFVRFAVADTGTGLTDEHLSHVFDRYWQAKKEGRLGIGLGLSIAKGIVEAHSGTIGAESVWGKGTTFYFTLPRHNPAAVRVS
jgi:PAS domain S-box-containing protein